MIHITMARRGDGWGCHPCNYPIIAPYAVSLGQLILHNAYRFPDDPVYRVETIGL